MECHLYFSSNYALLTNKILSWDRGFDAEGNYVWGAEKAGYIFEKIKN